jgi:hypothetical protein
MDKVIHQHRYAGCEARRVIINSCDLSGYVVLVGFHAMDNLTQRTNVLLVLLPSRKMALTKMMML